MLLTTKFFTPRPCNPIIHRPRLYEKLDAGLATRLTLISATAGFGKTMAVADWLHHLRTYQADSAPAIAWLSLEESDNDPSRFFAYLLGALQRIDPLIGSTLQTLLQSPQTPPWESIIVTLINELSDNALNFLLVLDDYHFISAQEIQTALTFLIEHIPPNLHLLVTTRHDPPWPLARWRVRRQVVDIRSADLRFSTAEIEQYLAQTVGKLAASDVAALEHRTEGWIAGLQLAALPLASEPQSGELSLDFQREFVTSLSGSQRYVMDYLIEEVLQRQTEPIQRFLLQTSVLDRLCPGLCSALLAEDDRSESALRTDTTLEALVSANLFLMPLDDERRWYRYHHLFVDMLRTRLQQNQPQDVARYHARASRWFAANGLSDEAIHHALAAGDETFAATIVEKECEARLRLGQLVTLQGWLERLSASSLQQHPSLLLAQARMFVMMHKLDAAQQSLQNVRATLQKSPSMEPSTSAHWGYIAAIEAGIALNRGSYAQTLTLIQQALTQLPATDPLCAELFLHQGLAHSATGNPDAARQSYANAAQRSQQARDVRTSLLAMSNQGGVLHSGGQLHQAARQYEATLHYALEHNGQQIPTTAYAYQMLGDLSIEWNDLAKAANYLTEARTRNERGAQMRLLALTHTYWARLHFAQGELAMAQENIHAATKLVHEQQLPLRYAGPVQGFQVRLWLTQGEIRPAAEWAAQSELRFDDEPLLLVHEERYLALARVAAAQNHAEAAWKFLQRYQERMLIEQRLNSVITTAALQAVILHNAGEKKQALTVLHAVLPLALPEKYVRTFVDEGEPMRKLLVELYPQLAEPKPRDYVNYLLAAFPQSATLTTPPLATRPSPLPPHPFPLIEPLSERELEILGVVAEGLSDRLVAERLIIAIGTVKKHLNNIYGKLGVANRTGALARARELGLL